MARSLGVRHWRRRFLGAASIVVSCVGAAVGCSSEPEADDATLQTPQDLTTDPGDPELMYGTKGGAFLYVNGQEVGYVFFRVGAPVRSDLMHFFARPDNNASINVKAYYLSLVLDDTGWQVGDYNDALGGRASFELQDGSRFSGEAKDLVLQLAITKAARADVQLPGADDTYYVAGTGTLTVPAEQAGADALELQIRLN